MENDPQNGKSYRQVTCLIQDCKSLASSMPALLYSNQFLASVHGEPVHDVSNGVDPHGRHQVDDQPVDEPLIAFEEENERDDSDARHQSSTGKRELNDERGIFCTVGQVVTGVWACRSIASVDGGILHV